MNVGGLNVHLDGCCLDVFFYLEKDFFFGADVQSGEEVDRRVDPSWYMGDFEVKLEYKIAGVPQGGWYQFGLKNFVTDLLSVRTMIGLVHPHKIWLYFMKAK